MRKGWLIFFGIVVLLGLVYFLGPRPSTPVYNPVLPVVPSAPAALTQYINSLEAPHKVKPDNEARIVWFDTLQRKTPYVLLYLHGFSASQEEGNPVHRDFAKRFGCNMYLTRLAEHGIDTTDAMINLTADKLWNSAKEAYAIARKLGDSVIIMGTSTGASLALQLAAAYPDDPIKGLVLMSPNIEINNPAAFLLDKPWGLQIARMVLHSKFHQPSDTSALALQYWNSPYRLEAVTQLQEYTDTKMTQATFQAVTKPTLLLYYYKDEQHQDQTVKVAAELRMFSQLSTPPALKRSIAIPDAGDHVLGSHVTSHDVPSVQKAVNDFAIQLLQMNPLGQAAADTAH